jgi:hypothetical protein
MAEEQTDAIRVCACIACRDLEADRAAGTVEPVVYGNSCANCGFYSPLDEAKASGVCCKLELSPGAGGMNLYHRKREELRSTPIIVGACFACNAFRPVHEVPNPETFWRSIPTE